MKLIPVLFLFAFPAAAAAPSAETLSVGSEQVNVRSGPGADFDVVWQAVRLYPLEVLEREGDWVRVSDYAKDEGWVYGPLLADTPCVVVVSLKANVREGPGSSYAAAWVVEKEFPMKVLEVRGSWYRVTDEDGLEGWIHKSVTWGYSDNTELEAAGSD